MCAKPETHNDKAKFTSVWLDENAEAPIIAEKARRLESFLSAMADGRIDDAELKAQQARLVKLMKEVEPMLDEKLHAKVTELLCELAAFDLMQVLHSVQSARPKTVFQG
jgi:hypothetical protein